jgi:hypothetical protein
MRPPYTILLFLFVLTFSKPHAQSLFEHPAIGMQGYWGSFLTHCPKPNTCATPTPILGEVALQQQTDGRKAWQVANGFRRWA